MKTLYATDLDGTLLDPTAHLSKYSAEILNKLKSQGALITFVTARTPATIEPILSRALPDIPGVAMTGATLWNPSTRQYEMVTYHQRADVEIILEICLRHGVTPFVYTLPIGTNGLVVYHSAPVMSKLENKFVADRTLNDLKTFKLSHAVPDADMDIVVLFFAMGDPQGIRLTARDIISNTDCYASWYPDTYHPGVALLEVFKSGVSKAKGLQLLRQMVGADRVVAFGDNLNDIPMLQAADLAVAVDNAYPEVKEVADVVIGASYHDAVAHFIDEDFHAACDSQPPIYSES